MAISADPEDETENDEQRQRLGLRFRPARYHRRRGTPTGRLRVQTAHIHDAGGIESHPRGPVRLTSGGADRTRQRI